MEPEYGKGPVMDAGFDNWSLVPLSGVSIVFVALFGVVINVGLARPPPETPPSNSVESVIDRPLLHVSTIDCLLLHASPIVDHHLFHGLTYAAADLCPFLGAGFYGARSTADFCLSLDYGWYSGGVLSTAELRLSLGAGWYYGGVQSAAVLGGFSLRDGVFYGREDSGDAIIMWTSSLLGTGNATLLILWTELLEELSWSVPYYATGPLVSISASTSSPFFASTYLPLESSPCCTSILTCLLESPVLVNTSPLVLPTIMIPTMIIVMITVSHNIAAQLHISLEVLLLLLIPHFRRQLT